MKKLIKFCALDKVEVNTFESSIFWKCLGSKNSIYSLTKNNIELIKNVFYIISSVENLQFANVIILKTFLLFFYFLKKK